MDEKAKNVIETDVVAVQEDDEGVPSRVNDYAILAMLGEGSFSKVYHCQNSKGGEYALKILKKSFLKRKREYKKVEGKMIFCNALDKVQREVAIMKKLAHTNLVKLHEIIDSPADDKMFLVLELVQGGQVMNWDDKAFRYRAPNTPDGIVAKEDARNCMRDVVMALSYLLTTFLLLVLLLYTQNILLTSAQIYKLADFGVAHMLDDENKATLRSTEGTYHFLAPECTTGEEYDPLQVDIWALGVTLYAMLQGTLPFGTKAASLSQVMDSIREDPLVFGPDIEPDCAEIMLLMLEKDPKKRIRVQDLKGHPWILQGSDLSRRASRSHSIIEVTQQEIEAAFTPVNNFILMTKLKMKMSSRLARARKSVELRHNIMLEGTRTDSALGQSTVLEVPMVAEYDDEIDLTPHPAPIDAAALPPYESHADVKRRKSSLTSTSTTDDLDSLLLSAAAGMDRPGGTTSVSGDASCVPSVISTSASTSPTNHRMSIKKQSPQSELRLPPLDISLSPASSPVQSPSTSPMHKERGVDSCGTNSRCPSILAPRHSIGGRHMSELDGASGSHLPSPESCVLDTMDNVLGHPTAPQPRANVVDPSSPGVECRSERPTIIQSSAFDSPALSRTSEGMMATYEPSVMLQNRKSGLPADEPSVMLQPHKSRMTDLVYAQALAEAKQKSSLAQRAHPNSVPAIHLDVPERAQSLPWKTTESRSEAAVVTEVKTAGCASNSSSSSSNSGSSPVPHLAPLRSPSRTVIRTKSLELNTTPEQSPQTTSQEDEVGTINAPPMMHHMSSAAKALGGCLELEQQSKQTPANASSRTYSHTTTSVLDATDVSDSSGVCDDNPETSPKIFQKRKSNTSPATNANDNSSMFSQVIVAGNGGESPSKPLGSSSRLSMSAHGATPFENVSDEYIVSTSSPDAHTKRGTTTRVFSKRRSLLEAQDSLQALMRRKGKLILHESNGSSVYDAPDDRVPGKAAPSASTSIIHGRRPPISALGSSVASLIRSTSEKIFQETSKSVATLRSQKTAVCNVM